MLTDYFRDTATISRAVVTGNKTAFEEVGSISCHIQPISDVYAADGVTRMSKMFRLFSTSNVTVGDRISNQLGASFEVVGAKKHTFRGRSHYEATLRGL